MKLNRNLTIGEMLDRVKPMVELGVSRNEQYGNSIAVLDCKSMIALVSMKLVRTANMLESINIGSGPLNAKWYDEIMDSINYLSYVAIRNYTEDLNTTCENYEDLITISKNKKYITESGYMEAFAWILNKAFGDSTFSRDNIFTINVDNYKLSYGELLHGCGKPLWENLMSEDSTDLDIVAECIASLFVILNNIESELRCY